MRKVSKPESYVEPESAARMLREMADEVEQRKDGQLISILIERKYASQKEIDYSLRPRLDHTDKREN